MQGDATAAPSSGAAAAPYPPPHAALSVDVLSPAAPDHVRAVAAALGGGGGWGVSPDAMRVDVVSGGITNALYRVRAAGRSPLLVRVFGANTELLIDRRRDTAAVAALAACGVGVPFLGTFDNGRVEGYLAARALAPEEMGQRAPRDLATQIAVEVARLHALRGMPGDPAAPALWPTLERWMEDAAAVQFDPVREAAKAAAVGALDLPGVARELAWLRSVLPSPRNAGGQALLDGMAAGAGAAAPGTPACRSRPALAAAVAPLRVPAVGGGDGASALLQARIDAAAVAFSVVYAHNDLLSGNLLVTDAAAAEDADAPTVPPGRVQLIDYEYADFNYLAYDVANHFCESMGFEFREDGYPSDETQEAWLRAYLRARGVPPPTRGAYARRDGDGCDTHSDDDDEDDDVTAAFFAALRGWVNRFVPASDLWWGTWAVQQAKHSPIDFDFASYAGLRLRAYARHKRAYWGEGAGAAGADA